ncbi:hypothetical protein FA95DRAFT_1562409 [Auriscalpium vulgare]|uniref:Uncharacterized protein n=1 Tax=Auriscalpium vulgare TaxID=40419 RepID=A0ACB8RKW1_9AGAM|nr:hypothetical protein FA95DRAFT_1562409 [Auriscalpium vulgare]
MDHRHPPYNANVPHFIGYVETTTDALRLIMAARQGVIPRITRRLNDLERRSMIRSGAVFVFCVEESGIKRWTEGLSWSPSRIIGNFLVYRETTDRNVVRGAEPAITTPGTSSFQLSSSSTAQRYRHRSEVGVGRSGHAPAATSGGLIKKTITVKVEGTDHHLVSYYREEDLHVLQRPTARPDIMGLSIPPEMVRATSFRHPPHIEVGPDGRAQIYDAEESDTSRRQNERASSSPATAYPTPTAPQLSSSSSAVRQPPSPMSSPPVRADTAVHGGTHARDTLYGDLAPVFRGHAPARPYSLESPGLSPPSGYSYGREAATAGHSTRSPTPWTPPPPGLHPADARYSSPVQHRHPARPGTHLPVPPSTPRNAFYTGQEQHSPELSESSSGDPYSPRINPAPYSSLVYPHRPASAMPRDHRAHERSAEPATSLSASSSVAWNLPHTQHNSATRSPSEPDFYEKAGPADAPTR